MPCFRGVLKDCHTCDHTVAQYIKDNRIDQAFLTMMGSMAGPVPSAVHNQTLQLMGVLNNFFEMEYNSPLERHIRERSDERYRAGFSRYSALTPMNVLQIVSREKNYSRCISSSIHSGRAYHRGDGNPAFPFPLGKGYDLVRPYLPSIGAPESHIARFDNDEIREIPNSISCPRFPHHVDAYGIDHLGRLQDGTARG